LFVASVLSSNAPPLQRPQTDTEGTWSASAEVYEYGSAANPDMAPIPVLVHPPSLHESGQGTGTLRHR